MNQQAMLRKIRQLQKEMMETQAAIEATEFKAKSNMVTVTVLGNKELKKVELEEGFEITDSDDLEMLSDMIVAACNICYKDIQKYTEEKMAKYQAMMGGFGGMF